MGKEDFPKKIRIKKNSEFNQIIKTGTKKLGENIVLYRLDSSGEGQRFGIKISRGMKGAVQRNKIKRIIRETLRKNKERFDPNEKVVVLVKSPTRSVKRITNTPKIDFEKLKVELENLINPQAKSKGQVKNP
jgi:ribonuclease P protein component